MMTTEPPQEHADLVPPGSADTQRPPSFVPDTAIDSQWLLRGHKEALIAHNGVTYRLQATRQGKLILIK